MSKLPQPAPDQTAVDLIAKRPRTVTIPAWQLPDVLDAAKEAGGHTASITAQGTSRWTLKITWPATPKSL